MSTSSLGQTLLTSANLAHFCYKVSVVVASWNEEITERLLEGAENRLQELEFERVEDPLLWNSPVRKVSHGSNDPAYRIWRLIRVPGSYELPLSLAGALRTSLPSLPGHRQPDIRVGALGIGCILKGETDHDRLVAEECISGASRVALDEHAPVTLSVLSGLDLESALKRSDINGINRGTEAAEAVVRMMSLNEMGRHGGRGGYLFGRSVSSSH